MPSSPSSSTPPPAPPRAIRPHVLLVLTDQQSLWTISAYHRLLRDGGYAPPCAPPVRREGGPRHFLGAAACEEVGAAAGVPPFADGLTAVQACGAAYAGWRGGYGPCVWRDGGCRNGAECART